MINVLRAYKCIQSDPKAALEHCDEALVSLRKFNEIVCSGRSSGNKLIQKFEILINDWLLSAQTYVWTNNKLKNMALFNQTLKNFQNLILDFPELNCKVISILMRLLYFNLINYNHDIKTKKLN